MMDVNLSIFLDTNFLVRANVISAPEYTLASSALSRMWQSGVQMWISRQIMREYAAVVSRTQTFMKALSGVDTAARLRQFELDSNIGEDSRAVTTNLLKLIETIPVGGKQIHDANIVATMQAYSIPQLLTFNVVDFTRFTPLTTLVEPDTV